MAVRITPDYSALQSLLDRPIAFHRVFVPLTGGVLSALMLSQAIYWTPRGYTGDGWFHKSQEEWQEEIGLSRWEQETARKRLRVTTFWQEDRRGIPAKMWYRVDLVSLYEAILGNAPAITIEDIITQQAASLKKQAQVGAMRAKKMNRNVEDVDYAQLLREKGLICGICGLPILRGVGKDPGHLTFDHILALNHGGDHVASNIQPAHTDCNGAKSTGETGARKYAVEQQSGEMLDSKPGRNGTARRNAVDQQSLYTENTTDINAENEMRPPQGRNNRSQDRRPRNDEGRKKYDLGHYPDL
jgi:5-methylcytosine-specific restriction endonuclease McrA